MKRWLTHALAVGQVVLACVVLATSASAADNYNGHALTPPMGYNTWNAFACNINEDLIKSTADAMKNNGMQDAGYRYVNLDDCWQDGRTLAGAQKMLIGRGADGHLRSDPVNFPSGMKALGDYIHAKGLKFGLYSSNGTATCQNVAGTLGHETTDANDYAAWGVDYFKLDTCNSGLPSDPKSFYTRYKVFSDALLATGRDIVFSLCDFTQGGQTWLWGTELGNLWRTTGDISASFTSMLNNFTSSQTRRTYAGPGHWNDPDMLEIGTGGFSNLAAPAKIGDTNVQVVNAGSAVAGSAFRVGTTAGGDLESFVIGSTGTAAGAATSLFAPAAAGDTTVKVGSVTGFTVGNKLLLDTDGTYESPTITAVGTAGTATTLADAAAAGDTNVKVASIANLEPGDSLAVNTGTSLENAKIATVGTAAGAATTLAAPAAAGATSVSVAGIAGFTVGDPLVVDSGASAERATVTSIGTAASAATTTVAPTAVGATNVKVASITGLTAGHPLVLDTGSSLETATIQSVGTAAGAATTTVAPNAVGDTNIKVSSVTGFTVGHDAVMFESGAQPLGTPIESATITAIGTAAGAQTTSVSPNVAGDTNVKVASIAGFTVGQPMQIKESNGDAFETANVTAIGTAAGASTTLAAASAAGDTNLKVTSNAGFVVGQQLAVGVGKTEELATVTDVGTAGATGTGITVAVPLAKAHLILMLIRGLGTGITVSPLTKAHASGSTTRGQGTGITVAPLKVAHPLATTGTAPGGGISIRDAGTGVTVTPLAKAHDLGVSTRDTGTGIGISPLAKAHDLGAAARGLGTGVTLAAALAGGHASGTAVRDESKAGTGITFTPALGSAHPVNAITRGGGTGFTLTTPVTRPHANNSAIGKSGMSLTESRTHFSLWTMAAAPLLAGTDVVNIADQNLAIYLNKDAIAVDQDPLGVQAFTVTNANSHWVLQRPLANGDHAVAFFNAAATDWALASSPFDQLGLDPAKAYLAKDLWTKQTSKLTDPASFATIPTHATTMLRVSDRAPSVTVPTKVTAKATAATGIAVSYDASGADAFDGSLPLTCSSPSGSNFPIGPTWVTCSATDAAGRSSSASFVVEVAPPDHPLDVGGTVPATLSLTLGAPATFGAFTPGLAHTYTASTTANVISTAGNATLSVSDPGHLTNGTFALPETLQVAMTPASWTGPVSNGAVTIAFTQHIGATDALRTGAYSRTLTFTLSTTAP